MRQRLLISVLLAILFALVWWLWPKSAARAPAPPVLPDSAGEQGRVAPGLDVNYPLKFSAAPAKP